MHPSAVKVTIVTNETNWQSADDTATMPLYKDSPLLRLDHLSIDLAPPSRPSRSSINCRTRTCVETVIILYRHEPLRRVLVRPDPILYLDRWPGRSRSSWGGVEGKVRGDAFPLAERVFGGLVQQVGTLDASRWEVIGRRVAVVTPRRSVDRDNIKSLVWTGLPGF
jgi:hypothetical protein